MAAEEVADFLDWDSSFFKLRIGRVRANRLNPTTVAGLQRWCQHQRIDCLYLLADADDPCTFKLASASGFELIDIRITLQRKLPAAESARQPFIRMYRREDLPALHGIAARAHLDTRFVIDTRFPRQAVAQLYGAWIDRDAAQGIVLVAEERGLPVGYVTGRLRQGENRGEIGVLAVDRPAQGRGLGRALLNAALDWFMSQGAREATVVTQGRNLAAQRLYQSAGFQTASLHLWYHLWRSN